MKKHLNTLFVTSQGAYLSKEGETVVVKVDREVRLRVPVHTLGGIVCFGNVGCSPYLMGFCAEKSVCISFLSEHGRFLARVQGPVSGNVLLRREQYRRADDPEFSADMARYVITGKIANCRTVLHRALRDHQEKIDAESVRQVVSHLGRCLISLGREKSLDNLRGIEGEAAEIYFGLLNGCLADGWTFERRTRRPPEDHINALLSLTYSMMKNEVLSALRQYNLDPFLGILHADRHGRPALALDLQEEFRPIFCDAFALRLINKAMLKHEDFQADNHLKDYAFKIYLEKFDDYMQEEFTHPRFGYTVSRRKAVRLQAILLRKAITGELKKYYPLEFRK